MTVSGPMSRPWFRLGGALMAAVLLALIPQNGPALRAADQFVPGPALWRVARKVSATRSFGSRSLGQKIRGCFLGLTSPVHIVVVDKAAQRLYLYRHYKHTTLVKSYPCATGENPGHKVIEGDHRTPEGVYFFIRVYRDNRMTIFGRQAWHLNYPNPVDRLRGRRGNGIYIHGLNKKLTPRSTKGCIALRQSDLDNLSHHLRLYRTPVVVTSRLRGVPRFNDPESCRRLRAIIKRQGHTLVGQRRAATTAVYTPRHLNRDLHLLAASQVHNLAPKKVTSRQFGLIRFQNQTHVWFLQELTLADRRKAEIWRRLTYLDHAGRPGLLASEWRPLDLRLLALAGPARIRVASRTPSPPPAPTELSRRQRAIVRLVNHWRQAWQKRDLPAYIACYDRSFRAQGMNRAQWRRYKGSLNRRYRFIRIKVSGLQVALAGSDRALATFHQNYRSNYFHSRSFKSLELIKRNGRWLIRREESGQKAHALRLAMLRRVVALRQAAAVTRRSVTVARRPVTVVPRPATVARRHPVRVASRVNTPVKVARPARVKPPVKPARPIKVSPPVKPASPVRVKPRVKVAHTIKVSPSAKPSRPVSVKPPAKAAPTPAHQERNVANLIHHWRRAWQDKDLPKYIACYDRSFRSQGMNRDQWRQYKGSLNRRYSFIRVKVSRLRVRLEGAHRAVATFHLSYRSNYFHSNVVKTLELVRRDGRWLIRREKSDLLFREWLPKVVARRPVVRAAPRPSPPVKAAPAPALRDRSVANLVHHWRQAWQRKDLSAYIACYDRSFHSQGMNRSQWKRYKGRLNSRYRFIRVKVSHLRVRLKGADRAVATFRLSYRSDYFHSLGVKTLELVRRQGRWQIRRETFRRLGG